MSELKLGPPKIQELPDNFQIRALPVGVVSCCLSVDGRIRKEYIREPIEAHSERELQDGLVFVP